MTTIQVIGIDPGVNTGFARKERQSDFAELCTLSIYAAQERVLELIEVHGIESVLVAFEDCRMRQWIPPNVGPERIKGVGSVERDCSIWQEFCERNGIIHVRVHPKDINTKDTKDDKWAFAAITDHPYDTASHARDAGMLARKYHRMIRTGEFVMPAPPKPIKKRYPVNRKLPKKPDKVAKTDKELKAKIRTTGKRVYSAKAYQKWNR